MQYHEVASRLEKRIGLGEFPLIRRRLYNRLQRLCEQRGDCVLIIIAAVVEEALAPRVRDKGLYFCSAVKRRLIEQRLWPECAGANQTREEAEALGRDLAARFVGSEDALPAPAVVPPAAPRAPSEARARMQALLDAERRKGGDR